MDTELIDAGQNHALERALELLWQNEPVAFPTDTVYGVGALVFDSLGIQRLYEIKGRETDKAIPILVGDAADLERVTGGMNPLALRLAERFWPGPLTLVVPRHPQIPEDISPGPTVGVRMPDHPVALKLLRMAGPLATTSANRSGEASPRTAQDVLAQLGGRIRLVLDGGTTQGGTPSTVVDCLRAEPVILRPGPISLESLRAALTGEGY